MSEKDKEIGNQILDLLLDALLERQREREQEAEKPSTAPDTLLAQRRAQKIATTPAEETRDAQAEPGGPTLVSEPLPQLADAPATAVAEEMEAPIEKTTGTSEEPEPEEEPAPAAAEPAEPPPQAGGQRASVTPLPGAELGHMLGRLFLALIVLVVLINIPYNRFGTSLARAMPDSAALVIRDGLLLKGSGEKVYVLEDNQRRWITTLDAFEEYGYRWDEVHVVEDSFLEKFEEGLPIHLLLKCRSSPHIYALEDGKKRWIKDIPTFEAQGYVWEDVRFIDCGRLRDMPDGLPIPEDAGPPPQP